MNTLVLLLGAMLIAIGILMHGNRSGWFLFIVTHNTVAWLAAIILTSVLVLASYSNSPPDQNITQNTNTPTIGSTVFDTASTGALQRADDLVNGIRQLAQSAAAGAAIGTALTGGQ